MRHIRITRYSKQNAEIICTLYRSIIRKTKIRFPDMDLSRGIQVNNSNCYGWPLIDQPYLNALGFIKYNILYQTHREFNLQDLYNVHKSYDKLLDYMEEDFDL